MKRVTKAISALLIAISFLSLCSCSALDTVIGKEKSTTFTADYDYGSHNEGKASILLDYNIPFFKTEDYGMSELIAGDKVTVTFRGELLIQESYPGRVVTSNARITGIEKSDAKISSATVVLGEAGALNVILAPTAPLARLRICLKSDKLISEDLSFRVLDENDEGLSVYASYTVSDAEVTVYALYDHNPR